MDDTTRNIYAAAPLADDIAVTIVVEKQNSQRIIIDLVTLVANFMQRSLWILRENSVSRIAVNIRHYFGVSPWWPVL